jgi:hypothetical protein
VFGHFVFAQHLADAQRDLLFAAKSAPGGFVAASTVFKAFSVASNSSLRLRARSSAGSGLRQAIRRSPV